MNKWKEYKEKRERQKYFRSKNDLHLDNVNLIKTIIAGLVTAIIAGIAIFYISETLDIVSSLFYFLLGYCVSSVVKTMSQVESKQVGIIAVVLTAIGSIVSIGLDVFYLIGFNVGFIYYIFSYLISDIFVLICIIVGCFIAYINAS